jgi:mRNA interferase MazF
LSLPRRGEVWLADLNAPASREETPRKAWPCLVMQTDLLNGVGHPSIVVIPGTAKIYRDTYSDAFPLRVPVMRHQDAGGLVKETELLIDQIRAIAQRRLLGSQPLATLNEEQLARVQEALQLVLQL